MKLTDYISEEEILKIFTDFVSVEGHKDVEVRESKAAQFIYDTLKAEGIEVELDEIEKNRPNVYGYLKGEKEGIELMFNGHTDTIPGFTMDFEPFKPFEKDGKIYGRGTCDMKAGLTGYMATLIALKRAGVKLKKTVMLAGVIGEEERSKGTERLIKKEIVPNKVIIGEPTELKPSIAHKGMEWIEVKFTGRSTHGSRPKEGINAVYLASKFCNIVREDLQERIESRTFDLVGHGTINVGVIKGGNDPNIVPDECIVQIDRRWLPSDTLEGIHKEVEDVAKSVTEELGGKYKVRALREFTASMINAPHSIDREDDFVKETLESCEKILGYNQEPVAFPAWSDAGLLSNHVGSKCIIIGPGNINQAHSNDEFCKKDEIIKAGEIYFDLALKICS